MKWINVLKSGSVTNQVNMCQWKRKINASFGRLCFSFVLDYVDKDHKILIVIKIRWESRLNVSE